MILSQRKVHFELAYLRASWLQIVFAFFPFVVIFLSTLLPFNFKSGRLDDIIAIVLASILFFMTIAHSLVTMKCKASNYKWVNVSLIIIIPLVGWIIMRGNGYEGLEFGMVFLFFFMLLIFAFFRSRVSRFRLKTIIKVSLFFYLVFIFILMIITGLDNDVFLEITSVNVNNVILPILPSVAWWARSSINSWRKSDIFIATFFVIDVLLTGSKQTIIISLMLLLVAMKIRSVYKIWLLFFIATVVIFFFLPDGSWLSLRFEQLKSLVIGDWSRVPSLINRLLLWNIYIDSFTEHWIIGFGMGNTHSAFIDSLSLFNGGCQFLENIHTPHNSFLRLLVEGGIVLLIGILLLHILILYKLIRLYKRISSLDLMVILVVVIFINAFFTEALYSWSYWAAFSQMAAFAIIPIPFSIRYKDQI